MLLIASFAHAEDDEGGAEGYVSPFGKGVGCVIRSKAGFRKHPILGRVIHHAGVDVFPNNGSLNIFAVSVPATILRAGLEGGCGYSVTYQTKSPEGKVRMCHCRELSVLPGQEVDSPTERLCYMGKTGLATGVHLHIEFPGRSDGEANSIMESLCKGQTPEIRMARKSGGATT